MRLRYNGDGAIHLRKYFKNDLFSEIYLEKQKEPITSPGQNDIIIKALLATSRRCKGKIFKQIITKKRV